MSPDTSTARFIVSFAPMGTSDKALSQLRVEIDDLDDELLSLLNRRAQLACQVGEVKGGEGPFYVPTRERAIIDRLQQANPGPFPAHAIRPVFQEIISACLSLEAPVKVAYLGPEATFTHQAVRRHFGTSSRTLPCSSIGAVFTEVSRGQAEFGVVPVENSTEGVVNHTLDSFLDPDVEVAIVAEISVDVDQCLLARPGVSLAEIERVHSHPQALAQCRGWLAENLPHATLVQTSSTAAAAQSAASDPGSAAISAELASRIYGLAVLRQKLQDVSENITRFLVVAKKDSPLVAATAGGAETDQFKTSLVLSLPDRPGCLHEILAPIASAGVNMTRIESRPTRRKAWDYVFFLDIDGHVAEPRMASLLEELGAICELCAVLGCYRKADTV